MLWLVLLLCLLVACSSEQGDKEKLNKAFEDGVRARQLMAKDGFGGSEITPALCGQHFDATEADMGKGKFRDLAKVYFIRGCRTPPERVPSTTTAH